MDRRWRHCKTDGTLWIGVVQQGELKFELGRSVISVKICIMRQIIDIIRKLNALATSLTTDWLMAIS
ncbi:hypothetical protein AAULR_20812 [Lacticaseibacillus rhamnosus MTCC 5462]|nr:hypothetical protein AAULR_20812 [Lacticaseibacillus rhamnosus MTCC 5462]